VISASSAIIPFFSLLKLSKRGLTLEDQGIKQIF
jgi:hypothetical protein